MAEHRRQGTPRQHDGQRAYRRPIHELVADFGLTAVTLGCHLRACRPSLRRRRPTKPDRPP
jgi:hypothetical protein